MSAKGKNPIADLIQENEEILLQEWAKEQMALLSHQQSNLKESELQEQCREFLKLLPAVAGNQGRNLSSAEWEPVTRFLSAISRSRNEKGLSPTETANFVFSLKAPLFKTLRGQFGKEPEKWADAIGAATELLDKLGLYTMEVYQKAREEVILRQQEDMLELSTPVVSLAEGILALPLIGTLNSARTQVVMESLLQRIVETGSSVAIIDITGVPTVDTLVAQHLLKTITAARLMGGDCIISGIRPQIAQTIVHLGVELGDVITKATLSAAFKVALERNGMAITRTTGIAKAQEKK